MKVERFIDTKILVYVLANDPARTPKAESVLAAGGVISIQVLGELASVASKKLKMPWHEINEALVAIRAHCIDPRPITFSTHEAALGIADRYGFAYYDSLSVASALEAGCRELLTEDLQVGQLIEGRLTVVNPLVD